ncbi:hypothetical protein GCM10009836_55570 [Pseudonocardia ailaonensis]|uniref:Uncharacterized protein n=1 Tax=Pseudonocardia ailaonensis TaxID=367279 RepID=A0ABN2NIC4_9PSEU
MRRLPPELADAARTSTHPAEVAVALESGGINDRVAHLRYATPDVFTLADAAVRDARDLPRAEPEADPPPVHAGIGASRWFAARGPLYAVPALIALALLPAGDQVESALLLGGLALSWALGYGVTSMAWSYVGALDLPAARRFLRRAILAGTAGSTLVAVVAVFGSLIWTTTMQVTLWTVALLVGQTVYLLSAAALLMTGHEARLAIALVPAAAGAVLGALDGRIAAPLTGPGQTAHGPEVIWLAVSVVLAFGLAMVATRGGARPRQPLPRVIVGNAGLQVVYGLMVSMLVLHPALFELTVLNYESLPLSVTLAALPLVLGMGVAEILLRDHRRRSARLLEAAHSTAEFARAMRRELLAAHLKFAGSLLAMTVVLGALGALLFGLDDARYVLLGLDYALLGTAIFGAMVLNLLGRIETVLLTCGIAAAVLVAVHVVADRTVSDLTAIIWQTGVAAVLLVAHSVLVHRQAALPVAHR